MIAALFVRIGIACLRLAAWISPENVEVDFREIER